MDFVNVIKDKVTEAAAFTAKKSGEVVEITKLKYSIMEANTVIAGIYKEIGELVYGARETQVDVTETIQEKCDKIKALLSEIEASQDRLNSIKRVVYCANCGKENFEEFEFCPSCGSKILKTNKQNEEDVPADEMHSENEEQAQE